MSVRQNVLSLEAQGAVILPLSSQNMMPVVHGTYLRVVAEQLYFDAERETQNVFHAQTAVGHFADQI